MGSLISYLVKGVMYVTSKIVVPLIKFMTYIMAVCFVFCVVSNLAGLFGLILFMFIFYYYIKGIIFIEPGGGGTGSPLQAIGSMMPGTNTASVAAKATATGMAAATTAASATSVTTAASAMKGVSSGIKGATSSIPSIIKK